VTSSTQGLTSLDLSFQGWTAILSLGKSDARWQNLETETEGALNTFLWVSSSRLWGHRLGLLTMVWQSAMRLRFPSTQEVIL